MLISIAQISGLIRVNRWCLRHGSYTVDEKAAAVEKFINESLNTIDASKDVVDMVQVGNETTGGFIGETKTDAMCKLFSAGSKGVKDYNSDVKVVIHVEVHRRIHLQNGQITLKIIM